MGTRARSACSALCCRQLCYRMLEVLLMAMHMRQQAGSPAGLLTGKVPAVQFVEHWKHRLHTRACLNLIAV